jgi:G patch domain/KOW motif-containing protein
MGLEQQSDRHGDKEKRRRHDNDRHDDRKRRKEEHHSHKTRHKDKDHGTWLIPNIRVRIITKKFGSQYYKEKAVVEDVTHRGEATLRFQGNQVLDGVSEKYLETALPKAGGNAIVLVGKSKHAKGKLLERDSRSGKGVIQVFEDMSVVTLSLDDMAEWVGPLDDDMME